MSLKKRLDKIVEKKKKEEAQIFSDDYIYDRLLKSMYEHCIIKTIEDEVSRGKTFIQGEFSFYGGIELDRDLPWSRISDNSSIYKKARGYDSPDGCEFQPLFTEKQGFFKPHAELTPLGERVYRDLKRLAQQDQITLYEPFSHVSSTRAFGKTITGATMHVKFEYKYR